MVSDVKVFKKTDRVSLGKADSSLDLKIGGAYSYGFSVFKDGDEIQAEFVSLRIEDGELIMLSDTEDIYLP